jgi:hypothetical protein
MYCVQQKSTLGIHIEEETVYCWKVSEFELKRDTISEYCQHL